MNKKLFTLVIASATLAVLPGCWFKKKATAKVEVTKKQNAKEVIE